MTASKRPLFGWSMEQVEAPAPITMEAHVEMRTKAKRLAECELPEGFRLITPTPRQYWIDSQLRWSFELAFGEHRHVARYIQQVADDVQMQWAIQDFTAELLFKGVSLEKIRKLTPREAARHAFKEACAMKTLALFLILFLVALTPLHAAEGILGGQATTHSDVLTWTPYTVTGATINVYRAAGACSTSSTFVKIANGVSPAGTYTDASPLVGIQCYAITATANGVESPQSNQISLTSLVSLPAPTGLAGTAN
jgi:hypothetical protein